MEAWGKRKMSRRDLLKLGGVSLAALFLAGCLPEQSRNTRTEMNEKELAVIKKSVILLEVEREDIKLGITGWVAEMDDLDAYVVLSQHVKTRMPDGSIGPAKDLKRIKFMMADGQSAECNNMQMVRSVEDVERDIMMMKIPKILLGDLGLQAAPWNYSAVTEGEIVTVIGFPAKDQDFSAGKANLQVDKALVASVSSKRPRFEIVEAEKVGEGSSSSVVVRINPNLDRMEVVGQVSTQGEKEMKVEVGGKEYSGKIVGAVFLDIRGMICQLKNA